SIQITVAVSANVVHFKDSVTITAHLNLYQDTTNPTVSIYKTVFNGNTYLVGTGNVDGNGDFAKTIQVYDRTSFRANWDGDDQHPPSESFQRVVQVQSVTTGTLSGYYGTDGNYKLYHFNSSCPSNGTNCPLYTVKVV